MTSDNDKTLKSYEEQYEKYVRNTSHEISTEFKEWLDRALSLVKGPKAVLEIGSGFGRDASYIKNKGYEVIATDAVATFVNLLKKSGHKARLLNVLTDDMGEGYGMIFANAVLLHLNPAQFKQVLIKIKKSLLKEGVLAFSVKEGEGSEWTKAKLDAPRYFQYWQEDNLKRIVIESGFQIVDLSKVRGPQNTWLLFTAIKT